MSESCHLCQIGDPHKVCQRMSEVYGTEDELRLDEKIRKAAENMTYYPRYGVRGRR